MQKTIKQETSAEIVEKKSKFIANIFYVQSEEDVQEKIRKIKKQFYDAKHNCYAYRIITKEGTIDKMSDDGEPSGTAGLPILNILQKKELVNILVVVTRYFGGILLGTGGLVKAYTEVTLEALKKTEFIKEELGYEIEIILDYRELEKLQYYCKKNSISIINVEYGEKIKCKIEVTKEEKENILNLKEEKLKIEKYNIIKEKNIKKSIEI